jgi:Spy/CpxP family protein refolding chaperone
MSELQRKEVISMKKTFIVGLGSVLGLALAVNVALGWGPGSGRGFGRAAIGVPPVADLTAEQSAQIQDLRDDFQNETKPLQDEIYNKRTELRNLWVSSNPDESAITTMQKEILNLQSQLQEKGAALALEVRKVLTPEQLAQLPASGPGPGSGPGMGSGSPMMCPRGRW